MKELSIEEKAKRYNEAIKVAENIHKFSSDPAEIKRMEQIFPELKESEDEKIRKALINQFNDYKRRGENHGFGYSNDKILAWLEKQAEHANFFNKIQIGDKVTRNRDGVLVNLSQLNRVAKPAERQQKPAFEMITPEESLGIDSDTYNKIVDECIYGEQKPVCSEEQREKEPLSDIENRILNFAMQFHDNRMKPEAEWDDELKMLRDNIKIDPWSEEDENGLGNALWAIEQARTIAKDENDMGTLWCAERWLKSLKERYTWKPSDLQMEALESATENCAYSEYQDCLRELIEQLKKLRGE